jgi:hypothetical protein
MCRKDCLLTLMVAGHRWDEVRASGGEVMLRYDLLRMLRLSGRQLQRCYVIAQRGLEQPRLPLRRRRIILPANAGDTQR